MYKFICTGYKAENQTHVNKIIKIVNTYVGEILKIGFNIYIHTGNENVIEKIKTKPIFP
jgi:hypothetical protein